MSHDVVDFEKDVIERSRGVPVLVDFWAEWCGPCRVLGPVIEKLAAEANGRWVLAKLDTEAFPEISARYDIQGIPNVKLFVNGEVVNEFVGAQPEPMIRRWLDHALPSPASSEVQSAAELVERGAFGEAATRLRAVLEAEPGNGAARLLLGRALLHTDPAAVVGTVRALADDAERHERAEALVTLARLVGVAETPGALPEAPERARFVEGLGAVRRGEWDAALAAFVDVLRADRRYADGAAREAGRAIFILLGIEHPACEKHYRAFAGAMNV